MNSDAGSIRVGMHDDDLPKNSHSDFAAWYFLPVAMRLDRDLHIEGRGTPTTCLNARRMSRIWESWVPGHLHAVNVSFSQEIPRPPVAEARRLIFLSGGLDATYTALVRSGERDWQDTLTIRGMDYSLTEGEKFDALLGKTKAFSSLVSRYRYVAGSDAYALYDLLALNLKRHHLSHIFSLAGTGFLFAAQYGELILAADDRIDAQFLTFPWGTNSATNDLFSDGITDLVSDSEAVGRPEKIAEVYKSQLATNSLSFCWNRASQPFNCGNCEKCLRTKLLFLALTGTMPDIFTNRDVPPDWAKRLRFDEPAGFHAVQEIFYTAADCKNEDRLAFLRDSERLVRSHYDGNPYWRWQLSVPQNKRRKHAVSKLLRKLLRRFSN